MRYTLSIFLSFMGFCLLWAILVYVQTGSKTQSSKWLAEAYELKEMSARKIRGNKVAIVSGSNSLFGFDSSALEKSWRMSVINDAVHAGLGLPYILYRSKRILNRGDIVILPLEYRLYQKDWKPELAYTDFVLSRDPDYFYNLPVADKLITISSVSIKRLFQGFKYYFYGDLKPTKGVYGVQNINDYGDQINLEPEGMSKSQFVALDHLSPDAIQDTDLSNHFIQHMDNYIAWAKRNGICLIAMPPNHLFFEQYRNEKYLKYLSNIKGYYASRDVMFIGNPFDYMYEKKYYFNTAYHLNSLGIDKRMFQIIHDIGKTPAVHCNF